MRDTDRSGNHEAHERSRPEQAREWPRRRGRRDYWRDGLALVAHRNDQRGRLVADLGNKPIAAPRNGFDESRSRCRVAEDLAETLHRCVEAVLEIDKRVIGPHRPAQLIACDEPSPTFDQDAEDSKGLVGHEYAIGAVPQLARLQIQSVLGERHDHARQVTPFSPAFHPRIIGFVAAGAYRWARALRSVGRTDHSQHKVRNGPYAEHGGEP